MSYKRISVRFMLERENHQKAWHALSTQTNGSMNDYIINAINQFEDRNHLRHLITDTLLEIIETHSFQDNHAPSASQINPSSTVDEIDDDAMKFIQGL